MIYHRPLCFLFRIQNIVLIKSKNNNDIKIKLTPNIIIATESTVNTTNLIHIFL